MNRRGVPCAVLRRLTGRFRIGGLVAFRYKRQHGRYTAATHRLDESEAMMESSGDKLRGFESRIVARWMEFEGELRVGLVRVVLLFLFYTAQLINFAVYSAQTDVDKAFHRQVTYISAAWMFVSLAVLICMSRYFLPRWLKFATVTMDALLLIAIAASGGGSLSPLVLVLPLLVALSAMRGSIPLIWYSTLLSIASYYVLVVGHYNRSGGTVLPTPITQMCVVLTILATGIVAGQLLRMVRLIVSETLQRSATDGGAA